MLMIQLTQDNIANLEFLSEVISNIDVKQRNEQKSTVYPNWLTIHLYRCVKVSIRWLRKIFCFYMEHRRSLDSAMYKQDIYLLPYLSYK